MENNLEKRALIGDALKKPWIFLIITLLPQIILLMINLQSYFLIMKELSPEKFNLALVIFTLEIILIGIVAGFFLYYFFRKKMTALPACWIILAAAVAYLWIFTMKIYSIIPASVSAWILPPNRLMFYQFAFLTPVVFYALLRIAAFNSRSTGKKDFLFSLIFFILPPAVWYAGFFLFRKFDSLFYNAPREIISNSVILICVLLTLATVAALTRLIFLAVQWLKNRGPFANILITFLICLALPIGGLILNNSIPFPVNYQYPMIYVMTILNAFFLVIPRLKNSFWNNVFFIMRGLFYPFSLYFFIVFLPFTPLSLIGVLFFGAGLLMLSPIALFVLHTKRLADDLPLVLARFKKTARIAILAAAALLPVLIFTSVCLMDKSALNTAVKAAFEPDYTAPRGFEGSRFFLERALKNMSLFKSGQELPFLSSYYNWIVFDNLVLPDEKVRYLSQLFFGREITVEQKRIGLDIFDFLSIKPVRIGESVSDSSSLPRTPVKLSGIEISTKEEGGFLRSLVTIKMKNHGYFGQEFLSEISLPEGVLVSKFSLLINTNWTEGRIFEKRTALWVYEMIKSYRRDPAVLYYRNKETLLLRVFPFTQDEERSVRIDFLYPVFLAGQIKIGDKTIDLKGKDYSGTAIPLIKSEGSDKALLPGSITMRLNREIRNPYLHFIIDWSASCTLKKKEISDKIREFKKKFPECSYYALTLANYESADARGKIGGFFEARDNSELPDLNKLLPKQGGFSISRAVKRVLLTYGEKTGSLAWHEGLYFPIIIVISSTNETAFGNNDFEYFDALVPDISGFYLNFESNILTPYTFNGKIANGKFIQRPVSLLMIGGITQPVPADNQTHWLTISAKVPLDLYEFDWKASEYKKKEFFIQELPFDYAAGISAYSWHIDKTLNPSLSSVLWKKIVQSGRKSGILNPDTSYIVVENDAQWKVLKEKEEQKLKNAEAMDNLNFKTPEPSIIILALLLFALFSRHVIKTGISR